MARAWHLMSRPEGLPTSGDFALKDIELPKLDDGMVHVRNLWLSVDPYMRGRMNESKSYIPPFQLDAPMDGGAVGEDRRVERGRVPEGRPGAAYGRLARRGGATPKGIQKLPQIGAEPQAFLGHLGMPGATAYFGLFDAAEGKGRRHRIRLGCRWRGRFGSRSDRQGQGNDGHRLGARQGQMRLRTVARRRRRDRLYGRPDHRLAPRSGAQGDRCLFRQCRRRSSRCRLRSLARLHRASRCAG
jgi:hypothetical protein